MYRNLQHRFRVCGPGSSVDIATDYGLDGAGIESLCPRYTLWPSQRHLSVTWILAQYVCYRMQVQSGQSLKDFTFYIRKEI
jgi:hypothetical protein